MPITFGRAPGIAEVTIDTELCTVCGLCVEVCPGGPLILAEGHIEVDQTCLLGCIACGQCMAVCPTGAVTVTGRDLSPSDMFPIPQHEARADYASLYSLLAARRSVRAYTSREVDSQTLEKVLAAASTAPMGLPPSEVGVLVFQGREQVQGFRQVLTDEIRKVRWLFSPFWMTLMSPFWGGAEEARMMRDFIAPVTDKYTQPDPDGRDWFFYDAPSALYFYGSAVADPGDVYVAATLAMLAAESLGLGTCLLGFPGYIMKYSKRAKEMYELPKKIQPGLAVIMGYPTMMYRNAIKRRFANVKVVN